MKRFIALAVVAAGLGLTGCSNADVSAMGAWGRPHRVKQFNGGKLVGEWVTTGKIENEGQSDGYYFTDQATGKLVMVSGAVQITVE